MKWPRVGGLLVHPTSLPGPFGVGDLGPAAFSLLDFLANAKQHIWQVLPLGPTGYGNSPYAGISAFAGNPLVISLERLVEDELLRPDQLETHPPFPSDSVDFAAVVPWKMSLVRAAFDRFMEFRAGRLHAEFDAFTTAQQSWLDDFALFAALKSAHGGASWVDWARPFATREPAALADAKRHLAPDVAFHQFIQFLFQRQWQELRRAAMERDIAILGDVAIFVAHDSADVWAHPELFQLDEHGQATVVAGVPPDYFSPTGQRWGNPLYRWDHLKTTGYAWWIDRIRRSLELVDYIRLDHFRGFHAYWEIPGDEATAVNGKWVPGPADALFEAIAEALGDLPFIAEDLGQITPGVHALRQRVGFPAMRVLQFAFSSNAKNQHLPHALTRDTIIYTGTHDNDTSRGWFQTRTGHERSYALRYLDADDKSLVWAMIRAAYASVANLTVVPLQDVLDLGSEARMNFPSRATGNWAWRFAEDQLSPALAKRLGQLATLYGR